MGCDFSAKLCYAALRLGVPCAYQPADLNLGCPAGKHAQAVVAGAGSKGGQEYIRHLMYVSDWAGRSAARASDPRVRIYARTLFEHAVLAGEGGLGGEADVWRSPSSNQIDVQWAFLQRGQGLILVSVSAAALCARVALRECAHSCVAHYALFAAMRTL